MAMRRVLMNRGGASGCRSGMLTSGLSGHVKVALGPVLHQGPETPTANWVRTHERSDGWGGGRVGCLSAAEESPRRAAVLAEAVRCSSAREDVGTALVLLFGASAACPPAEVAPGHLRSWAMRPEVLSCLVGPRPGSLCTAVSVCSDKVRLRGEARHRNRRFTLFDVG